MAVAGLGHAVAACGQLGALGQPVVGKLHVGGDLGQVVVGNELQQRLQGGAGGGSIQPRRAGAQVFTGVLVGRVHALGPAPDAGGALLHAQARVRVARQVAAQGAGQAVVGHRGRAAQQVGRVGQVGIKQVHEGIGAGLYRGRGGRCYAKGHAGAAHAFAGKQKTLVRRLWPQCGRQRADEVGLQKRQVVGVKVPAVVHGCAQQAFAAKQLQEAGQHRQHRVGWQGGGPKPQAIRFKMVNDVGAVLQPLALRRLHHRNDPAPHRRNGLGFKARVAGYALFKGNALLAQIAAHLGGVE